MKLQYGEEADGGAGGEFVGLEVALGGFLGEVGFDEGPSALAVWLGEPM